MNTKSNKQILSDRQFITMIVSVIVAFICIFVLTIFSANTSPKYGEFTFQLSDIVGITMLGAIGYAPFVLFPASIASFLYTQKRNTSMRWPLTFMALGIVCLFIQIVLSLLSGLG